MVIWLFLSPSLPIYFYLTIDFSPSLSISTSLLISLPPYLSLPHYLFLSLPIYLYLTIYFSPSLSISTSLFISLPHYLFISHAVFRCREKRGRSNILSGRSLTRYWNCFRHCTRWEGEAAPAAGIIPFPPFPLFLPDRPPHSIIFSPLPTSFDSFHIVIPFHLISYPILSCLNYCRVFGIPSFDFPCFFFLFLQNLKTYQQLTEFKPFRLFFWFI